MSDNFLYKYSPKSIRDFSVDNSNILYDDVNLLITGPPGSGKTSLLIAYIQQYLGTGYNIYSNENILFVNNLKDQGIQFCRNNVKTFCQTPCTQKNKKKIIVIDDIDEFSEASQQVISNCLSKFPYNVFGIACCNNTLKVFTGLKSRMAFIELVAPTRDNFEQLCKHVIENENIKLNEDNKDELTALIVDSSQSYKILLNTLQKLYTFDSVITIDNISELITSINFKMFNKYLNFVYELNIQEAVDIIIKISESGISVIDILYEFFIFIKDRKTNISDFDKYNIIKVISKYMTIFNNLQEDNIELAFFTNDLLSIFE